MAMGGFFSRPPHSHTPPLPTPFFPSSARHVGGSRLLTSHHNTSALTHALGASRNPCTGKIRGPLDVCGKTHIHARRGGGKNIDEASSSHFPRK